MVYVAHVAQTLCIACIIHIYICICIIYRACNVYVYSANMYTTCGMHTVCITYGIYIDAALHHTVYMIYMVYAI